MKSRAVRSKAFSWPPNLADYVLYAAWHLACLSVIWVGVSWKAVAICAASYFLRMFGLIAGHHRYFSHRSYTLSRPMQFLMAFLGTTSAQRGLLWWVASHRYHHLHSDTDDDVHSPVLRSVLYAHSGWFLDPLQRATKVDQVPDLAKYPELVWISDWSWIPVTVYGLAIFALFGLQGFVWGFVVSTILVWHGIHALSSFAHTPGGFRRYPTADYSRNKWFLSLVTLGEGWHNNHHYYPASARHGFFWWEIDLAFYGLKALSWVGMAGDLKMPPPHVLRGEMPGFQRRVKRYERDLADVRRRIGAFLDATPGTDALKQRIEERLDAFIAAPRAVFIQVPDVRIRAHRELRREVLAAASLLLRTLGKQELARVLKMLGREIDQLMKSPPFAEILGALPPTDRPAPLTANLVLTTEGART